MTYSPHSRSLNATDISAQFEGFDVEFNDKVTLFPVQVEKQSSSRRRSKEFGAAKVHRITARKPGSGSRFK